MENCSQVTKALMEAPAKQWFVMQMVMKIGGRTQRRDVPLIQDLLFVHETKTALDPYVEKYQTLQYRYQRGKTANEPMTVGSEEVDRFILNNYEGHLLSIKGKRKKHLIIELPNLIAAAVEVQPEFIQLL